MKLVKGTNGIPTWLDKETRTLVEDIIKMLSERHPDLLTVILYGSVARHEERTLDLSIPVMLIFSRCLIATIRYWMFTRAIVFLIPLVWRMTVT